MAVVVHFELNSGERTEYRFEENSPILQGQPLLGVKSHTVKLAGAEKSKCQEIRKGGEIISSVVIQNTYLIILLPKVSLLLQNFASTALSAPLASA